VRPQAVWKIAFWLPHPRTFEIRTLPDDWTHQLASGQINMRKVDGWQTLATKPIDQPIDLAA